MGIQLEGPPLREPMVDKDGNITAPWQRWFSKLHIKTGGAEAALPVHLGGTGATNVVQAIANQTASSSSTSGGGSTSNASTQRKTFVLDSPASNRIGDLADTICEWDAAFPDASYTVTANYSKPSDGDVEISAVTPTGFTVTLSNKAGRRAAGSVDCIGVHP